MLSALTGAFTVDEAQTDKVGPGLLAFIVVLLLGVATFFLIRSMLYHLRKVPPTFDDDESGEAQRDGDSADPSAGPSAGPSADPTADPTADPSSDSGSSVS